MLRHDAVKHRSDAIDGHVWVTHPQDSVKLGEDEGHGRQSGGLSKHLYHRNTTDLQGKQAEGQRSVVSDDNAYCLHAGL